MSAPSISVCNVALAEVRAEEIATIDDQSAEAQACRRHYDDCLALLLEAHDWSFQKVTGQLTPLLVNDRPGEWLYAYAAPNDMAAPIGLVIPQQVPLSGVYYPWPYEWPRPPFMFSRYVYEGGTIYANVQGAFFRYTSNVTDETKWTATFKRALELSLASRLAYTLLNDRALKGDLIQQFEAEKRRAMADDINRQPNRDVPPVDEVALVRS